MTEYADQAHPDKPGLSAHQQEMLDLVQQQELLDAFNQILIDRGIPLEVARVDFNDLPLVPVSDAGLGPTPRRHRTPQAVGIWLRVHVTAANLPAMPEFLARVRQEFLGDSRFSLLLKTVGRWGGPNDESLQTLRDEEREPILYQLRAGALAGLPPSASFDPGNFCFASRPNSFVIRASGDIGKCTVALSARRNNRADPRGRHSRG